MIRDEQEPTSVNKVRHVIRLASIKSLQLIDLHIFQAALVKTTSINPHTSLPTTIALPQTPVPLNQLTSMANSTIQYTVSQSSSPLTPPSSFSSNSSLRTK